MGSTSSLSVARFDAEAPENLAPLWDDGSTSIKIPRYSQDYAKTTLHIKTGMGDNLILLCNGRQKGMTLISKEGVDLAIILKGPKQSYQIFKLGGPVYPGQQSVPNPRNKSQGLYLFATVTGATLGGKKISRLFTINKKDAFLVFRHDNIGCGTIELASGAELGTCSVHQGIKHVNYDNRQGFADIGLLTTFIAVVELIEKYLVVEAAAGAIG